MLSTPPSFERKGSDHSSPDEGSVPNQLFLIAGLDANNGGRHPANCGGTAGSLIHFAAETPTEKVGDGCTGDPTGRQMLTAVSFPNVSK